MTPHVLGNLRFIHNINGSYHLALFIWLVLLVAATNLPLQQRALVVGTKQSRQAQRLVSLSALMACPLVPATSACSSKLVFAAASPS